MKEQLFIIKFEKNVKDTIEKYDLLSKNDRVIVACSGGKDSTTILYLLKKFGYNPEAMIIDLLIGDYSKENLKNIKLFCKKNKIKLHVISFKKEFGYSVCYIRSILASKDKLKACTVCGILKRYLLNKMARELKATKLVTGHNLDDEAQTILMNLFKGDIKLTVSLGPTSGVIRDKKFVQRVKPLYFCLEKEVERYSKLMNFPVVYERCPCAVGTYRVQMRKTLNECERKEPDIKHNIVNNFLNILPELKLELGQNMEKLKYCKLCKEPARQEICSSCKLLQKLVA